MSQTETLMLVLLGFAAASFLALVIGRSLWKLARAIHRRKRDAELPAAMAALKADRDRLRAEAAMQARKFDVRIADLKARVVEQAAEVSRHRNRLEIIAADAKKREDALADREAETEDMRDQLDPLEAELAARTQTIQALEQQVHAKDETAARLNREIAGLRTVVADRDRALAALERAAEQKALPTPAAIAPEIVTAQKRVARRIAELTALSQEIASQRVQFIEERDKFSALRQAIALPAPPPIEEALDLKQPREQIDVIDEHGKVIEEKLVAAERESEALAEELKSLDAAWSKKIDELDTAVAPSESPTAAANENGQAQPPAEQAPVAFVAEDEEIEPRQRAAGNVVSLASRIKALQRDAAR